MTLLNSPFIPSSTLLRLKGSISDSLRYKESLASNPLFITFLLSSLISPNYQTDQYPILQMFNSPEPTTPTDDGQSHQLNGTSRPGTFPAGRHHPFQGGLRLPTPSFAATTTRQHELRLRPSCAPQSAPSSGYSQDNVLMTAADIEVTMPEVMEEYDEKRRAEGKVPWHALSDRHDERHDDVPVFRRNPRRRSSQSMTTQSSGVSKTKPAPSRSSLARRIGQTDLNTLGGQTRARAGVRSPRALSESQNDGASIGGGQTAEELQGGFEQMTMGDREE